LIKNFVNHEIPFCLQVSLFKISSRLADLLYSILCNRLTVIRYNYFNYTTKWKISKRRKRESREEKREQKDE
jgi:hypothetical protein